MSWNVKKIHNILACIFTRLSSIVSDFWIIIFENSTIIWIYENLPERCKEYIFGSTPLYLGNTNRTSKLGHHSAKTVVYLWKKCGRKNRLNYIYEKKCPTCGHFQKRDPRVNCFYKKNRLCLIINLIRAIFELIWRVWIVYTAKQTRDMKPMFCQYWTIIYNVGRALTHHWLHVSCLLGLEQVSEQWYYTM